MEKPLGQTEREEKREERRGKKEEGRKNRWGGPFL
jgi:hypothetical protein